MKFQVFTHVLEYNTDTNSVKDWRPRVSLKLYVLTILTLLSAITSSAASQQFDGLYYSAGGQPPASCKAIENQLYLGGVIIKNHTIYKEEVVCKLKQPKQQGEGIEFVGQCASEGEPYRELIKITKTSRGVSAVFGNEQREWVQCVPSQKSFIRSEKRPSNFHGEGKLAERNQNTWTFDGQSAFVSSEDKHFAISCEPMTNSSTSPVATISGHCPMCFSGDLTEFRLSVDGAKGEVFQFTKRNNAVGWESLLYYHPKWFDGIVTRMMSGRTLAVFENNNQIATFSLNGSSSALKQLRQRCR